jgi:hypothetical protein
VLSAPPRWLVPFLAVVVAGLLVAGAAGAVVVDDEEDDAASVPTASTTTAPSSSGGAPSSTAPSAIQAVVPEIEAFVARERGLPFKEPVKVTLLDDKAFRDRLLEDEEEDEEELLEVQRVLRAFHLLDRDVDLRAALEDLLGESVVGFYDAERKELVVRGAAPTPFVRSILAHELTHALQDQHFKLDRPELDERDDEVALGFSGLVEGDAVRIQERYAASLSPGERRELLREEATFGGDLGDVPDVLVTLLGFPYATGPRLVTAILRAGGQPRLDAAFTNPPTTAEQLLHPQLYLTGQGAVPVPAPPAGGKVIDQGMVGELGLLMMFDEGVDDSLGVRAARGWGGDWYVAWDEGSRTCIRATLVMDTPTDTQELRAALKDWAEGKDGVTLEGSDRVTVTSCN